MSLDHQDLEVAAVGVSLAAGCRPCTRYHLDEAAKAGAGRDDIVAALRIGATVAATALGDLQRQFDPQAAPPDRPSRGDWDRRALLTGIGAAVARNSVAQLETLISMAREGGIDDDEIMQIVGLAIRVKEKAAWHLTPVISALNADPAIAASAASLCT